MFFSHFHRWMSQHEFIEKLNMQVSFKNLPVMSKITSDHNVIQFIKKWKQGLYCTGRVLKETWHDFPPPPPPPPPPPNLLPMPICYIGKLKLDCSNKKWMSMIIISKYFCLHAICQNDSLDWILPSWNMSDIPQFWNVLWKKYCTLSWTAKWTTDMDYLK